MAFRTCKGNYYQNRFFFLVITSMAFAVKTSSTNAYHCVVPIYNPTFILACIAMLMGSPLFPLLFFINEMVGTILKFSLNVQHRKIFHNCTVFMIEYQHRITHIFKTRDMSYLWHLFFSRPDRPGYKIWHRPFGCHILCISLEKWEPSMWQSWYACYCSCHSIWFLVNIF